MLKKGELTSPWEKIRKFHENNGTLKKSLRAQRDVLRAEGYQYKERGDKFKSSADQQGF